VIGMSRARTAAMLAAAALASCAASGREVAFADVQPLPFVAGRVVTSLDMLESGRRVVDDYVAGLPPEQRERLRAVIARGKQATVGVHARFAFGALGTSYTEASGTGVQVAAKDGSAVVLTAGHTFDRAGSDLRVRVSMRGSAESDGQLVAWVYDATNDFAVVRCTATPPASAVLMPSAAPRVGQPIVALGYPERCGVDDAGRLTRFRPNGPMPEPLVLLCEVTDTDPLLLDPVAGALPLGGFSGGGLFDLDGNVVGVLTQTNAEWEPGASSVTFRVQGCSVAAMPIP